MPIIDIYNPCKQELSKWYDGLERKRMACLNKGEIAKMDEKAKRNYLNGLDKKFKNGHSFLYEGLARIESILEEIKNNPSLEHGKRLKRWLEELIKDNEQQKVIWQLDKSSEEGKGIWNSHVSFGVFLETLLNHVRPIISEAEQEVNILECLKRLNSSCQDFIDDHLNRCQANKRVVWQEESMFSYKKQKMEKASDQASTSPPPLKRINKRPAASSNPSPKRSPSVLFFLNTHKRELPPSREEDDISKTDDLISRLDSAKKYLHENYEAESPEIYIALLEQLTEGQKRVHHDVIDTLIRQLLICIKGIRDYENYTIRAKGYPTTAICSLEVAEEKNPSVDSTTISLTPSA